MAVSAFSHVIHHNTCHYKYKFNFILTLTSLPPGEAAWYWTSLSHAFSGITVWHTDIRMRNSLIYDAVGWPDWRFCGTQMQHNLLRFAGCNAAFSTSRQKLGQYLKGYIFWRWLSSGMLCHVSAIRVIALMVEAARTSEMSVNVYQTTWRNIPEDSHLHTCHRENLKSHWYIFFFNIHRKMMKRHRLHKLCSKKV
jgi:hypothetical protein